MNKKVILRFSLPAMILMALIFSCKDSSSVSWSEAEDKYVSTDATHPYDVLLVENSNSSFDMFAEVKDDPKDLYVGVFNTSFGTIDAPSVETRQFSRGQSLHGNRDGSTKTEMIQKDNFNLAEQLTHRGSLQRGRSEIMGGINPYSGETVGDTETFTDKDASGGNLDYKCTLRKAFKETQSGKTLKIWVEDTSWEVGGNEDYLITDDMLTFLTNGFLKEGEFNDIYNWETNIYGEEWGSHSYGDLIGDYNDINIVLADLLDDNLESGVAGYFWAKDNFIKTSGSGTATDISNERITFYIESQYLAYDTDGTWESSNTEAMDTLSTLVHEFQHMINFYQSSVLRSHNQETWLNELLSMATEDILSEKLGVAGPKGFTTSDGKAPIQGSNINQGRLPYYNLYPDTPFDYWLSDSADSNGYPYVLRSYSLMYAYGAYLMRNFGGPEALQKLQRDATNYRDLPDALNFGTNDTNAINNTIPLFNASVLLSSRTDVEETMRFNKDGWFSYTFEGQSYKLSSLDFYSYVTTPHIYSSVTADQFTSIPPRTFYFIEEEEDISGKYHIETSSATEDADLFVLMLK